MVAGRAKMRPRKPARCSTGRRPEWSRCAWVSSTASMVTGSKASGSRLRAKSAREPWKAPQSTSTRAPAASRRWQDPVTVIAAP